MNGCKSVLCAALQSECGDVHYEGWLTPVVVRGYYKDIAEMTWQDAAR